MRYIFVTGGVVSGVGKGLTTASIAKLLKARGLKVALLKIDPYINVDAGTMNPFQHGEVFVTEDGIETDLDLGHYERLVDENLTKYSNFTTGGVYSSVIEKERKGDFLGKTVQVIPHITNEIKRRIRILGRSTKAEVVITEIGGTVGDIESQPFLEAVRQMRLDENERNVLYVHVTMIAYIYPSDEAKTKPTQQSVGILRSIGIQPDILVCRCKRPLSSDLKQKIALFCNVKEERVIEAKNTESLYEIPLNLEKNGLGKEVCRFFGLKAKKPDFSKWQEMVNKIQNTKKEVKIALVGKYLQHPDAYISLLEALKHGAVESGISVKIIPIDSEKLEKDGLNEFQKMDGILVPGGFGTRGIEGKIKAIKLAREEQIPFLGLCLGLQLSVIEFSRNVCGLLKANSTEFNPKTPYPVIDIMQKQRKIHKKGGTMRLGAYPCYLLSNSKAASVYNLKVVWERHRHRYEVNPKYHRVLQKNGLIFSGLSKDKRLVEMIELKNHPFFLATQFHPEFKSRPNRPHPLFREFIKACK